MPSSISAAISRLLLGERGLVVEGRISPQPDSETPLSNVVSILLMYLQILKEFYRYYDGAGYLLLYQGLAGSRDPYQRAVVAVGG